MEDVSKFDVNIFLESCKGSSNQAYENLKIILAWLEDPKSQSRARIILKEIENFLDNENLCQDNIKNYHFSIDKLNINASENHENSLTLLQLPSIFTPEDWSFTFFEGLMRCPEDEFYQRSLAELGCGNGWISIALAQRYSPFTIYGFDINPRAIVCAKINLYLNAMNEQGNIIRDSQGKTLLDKVQFHVSDLLGYCLENKIYLDKIIGCIPQVLSPNLSIINNIVPENSTDEALYALSNYCSKQGFVEDQFGLGLIARSVEESIQVLKPNGKVILNLGGRPGQAVLNRLFTRRGFVTKTIWQTKIEQAEDTDILPLVDIEKKSAHRFEFFMSSYAKESISARTAYAFQSAGGRVFHSLNVIEAELKDTFKMKNILSLLKNPEYTSARGALDLTYDNPSLISEKISFLSRLAEKLQTSECFPYEGVKGTTSFRRRIAEFFRLYWKSPISAKNIFIAPNRNEIIKNFINIFGVKLSLIDSDLCKNLPVEFLNADPLSESQNVAIEIPKHCHSICELIEKLKPQLVVCCFQHSEIQNQDSFLRLIEVTKKYNVNLIFDFSEHFELSSFQKSNGIIEYLSQNYLPKHVTLICGLIYNKIFQDMDTAFLISENAATLEYFSNAAELTYSRPSTITQSYYDTILYNLLNFHIKTPSRDKNFSIRSLLQTDHNSIVNDFKISEQTKNAFSDPALESTKFNLTSDTIRLDYGENALPAPNFLKSILMESFARQNISDHETLAEEQISKYLSKKYGGEFSQNNVSIGNGVSPIFASITKFCARNNISLIFPTGTYGYFIAAAKFFGANIARIQTKEEFLFKYNCADLEQLFLNNAGKKYYLFFNAPVVNPMGQIYSQEEITNIFNLCHKYKVFIIMDTIFSGLEHKFKVEVKLPNLTNCAILGGISKEYAAAGLRFGYAYIEDKSLFKFVQKDNYNLIPKTLKYLAKHIFSLINEENKNIEIHLAQQKNILQQRAEILSATLKENGWEPLKCEGGLFLVAKPTHLVGKKLGHPDIENVTELNYDNVHEILFKTTGLLINGSQWCGIPQYCRFVLSVSEREFVSACEKIKYFYTVVN
ncbi:MAG: aminotransferase class I/II-fold pyridoxal phosphate-dependent enzyme [Bdellovibrionota bacterium]